MNDGKKKKPQKHKNKTAFKITFDSQALQHQKKVSLNNLCVRCTQQLQWKLQYNKYKKMTEPGRCNLCQQKCVYRTYMKACQPCVEKHNVCAKCLTPDYDQPEEVKVLEKDQKKQDRIEYNKQIDFMKTLQERSRRTVRRGLQKGKISWDNELEYFVDEQGEKMIGLHFRKGFRDDDDEDMMDEGQGDDDMFGDDDEDDMFGDQDDEQEEQDNKKKSNKKQVQNKVSKQQNKKNEQQQQQQDENGSDIQGDEVQCDIDDEQEQQLQRQLDKMEIDKQDMNEDNDNQDQWQQQEQQQQQKQDNKKSSKNKNKRSRK